MSEFVDYVRDQLHGIGPVTARPMFGGYGLYCRGLFFGLIAGDTLYLRTDARNRDAYTTRGLMPFKPRTVALKAYYPVPENVLEDPDAACTWARQALDAAMAAGPSTPKRRGGAAGARAKAP